jgi:hypothetical protein
VQSANPISKNSSTVRGSVAGGSWRDVTFAEAVGLIDGLGDWWVRRQRAEVEGDEFELERGDAA